MAQRHWNKDRDSDFCSLVRNPLCIFFSWLFFNFSFSQFKDSFSFCLKTINWRIAPKNLTGAPSECKTLKSTEKTIKNQVPCMSECTVLLWPAICNIFYHLSTSHYSPTITVILWKQTLSWSTPFHAELGQLCGCVNSMLFNFSSSWFCLFMFSQSALGNAWADGLTDCCSLSYHYPVLCTTGKTTFLKANSAKGRKH